MVGAGSSGARRSHDAAFAVGAYVAGTVALSAAMHTSPGSATFPLFATSAAIVWMIGAMPWRERVWIVRIGDLVSAAIIGLFLAALAVALAGAGLLGEESAHVADFAERGRWEVLLPVVLVSAVAEETLFRGAVHRLTGRGAPVVGTAAYVLAAAFTGSSALALASFVFGASAAAVRMSTGSLGPPIAMHATFSAVILFALPAVV